MFCMISEKRFRIVPLLVIIPTVQLAGAGEIQFNRDIRPILSDHCFACHGPDANHRKSGLRLDIHEGAVADLDGYSAVVPGAPAKSELLARITTVHEEDLMHPL